MNITSFEITIDGKTYKATNIQEVKKSSGQRLILSLVRLYEKYSGTPECSDEIILARSSILKYIFAQKFPNAPKFQEITQMFIANTDWKYILRDAEPEHIEWARIAKECGLIDSYLVDYDPQAAEVNG